MATLKSIVHATISVSKEDIKTKIIRSFHREGLVIK